jgi:Ca2+-binding RTX toxin-like protein
VASNATDSGYSTSVAGGAGNDTFASDALTVGQTVFAGGAGTDTLVMDWSLADSGVGFDGLSTFYVTATGYGISRITATSVERWQLTGSGFDDVLQGGALDDSLTGGNGADNLTGLAGIDSLTGGAGNDILIGGSGDDILTGGQGSDRFVFDGAALGTDTILDFNQLNGGPREGDVLEFHGMLVGTFAYRGGLAFTGESDNTEARVVGDRLLLDINGDKAVDITIILTGLTSANQLAAGDFLFT